MNEVDNSTTEMVRNSDNASDANIINTESLSNVAQLSNKKDTIASWSYDNWNGIPTGLEPASITLIHQKTTSNIDWRSSRLGNMFGLTNMITGNVTEEKNEEVVEKPLTVDKNNMNNSTLTPPRSGTIQSDEVMGNSKSNIDDKIKNKKFY